MANGAIRIELSRLVIRVGRGVVIRLVASRTGVGGIVIIAVVAGCAVVGNGCVCTIQWVIIVVQGEGCRHPAITGVAGFTIRWNANRIVVGVGGSIILRLVAPGTGIGRTRIVTTSMAIGTVGHAGVCAREWPGGIVVEGCRYPGGFTVALRTVVGEQVCGVVGIGRCGIISLVAAGTGVGRIVVIAVVASRAIGSDGGMCPVEWVIIVVQGECCRHPAITGMAGFTIG